MSSTGLTQLETRILGQFMIDSVQRSEDWGNNCCCFSGIDRSPIIHGTSLRLEEAAVIVLDTHTLVTLHRQFVNRFVLTIPRRPSLFLHGILAASARESRIKRNARGTRYRVRFSPGSGPHGRLRLSDAEFDASVLFWNNTLHSRPPCIPGPALFNTEEGLLHRNDGLDHS